MKILTIQATMKRDSDDVTRYIAVSLGPLFAVTVGTLPAECTLRSPSSASSRWILAGDADGGGPHMAECCAMIEDGQVSLLDDSAIKRPPRGGRVVRVVSET